ncbi:chromodomain-helicase-DNA-binding protein 7 [Diachasma alloeum]|uniref:chromodomain-helicase-DNA-binding protein 7 n=1 Tax=Diachasma alloeum TaxID=454923 RepID=UPI0007383D5C|nr:chromodomain-helicase-DNA-binding protein 7 [Diachasma alloeum]
MKRIEDSHVIVIDSDSDDECSWRGSKPNGSRSADRPGETVVVRSQRGNRVVRILDGGIFEVEDSGPASLLKPMRPATRSQSSFRAPPNPPQGLPEPPNDSLSSADTSTLGMSMDTKDPETSSGVSSSSCSISPTSWSRGLTYSSRAPTPEPSEFPRRLSRASRAPKPSGHDYPDSANSPTRYRTRSSTRTSAPGVLTPKKPLNTSSSTTPSQKRPKPCLIVSSSSDEENNPERSSTHRKRRRLIGPTEDPELQDNSGEVPGSPDPPGMLNDPGLITSINSPSKPFVIPSGAVEASKSFQNVLKYLEKIEESSKPQASNSLDPEPSRASGAAGNDEPPEFTDLEDLDEDLPLDTEPMEVLPRTSTPSTSMPKRSTSDEFEALEMYEPDEDVDVGWKTDEDFSDGEVPAQVKYTKPKKNVTARPAPRARSPVPWSFQNNYSPPVNIRNSSFPQSTRNCPPPQNIESNFPPFPQPFVVYPSSPPKRGRKNQKKSNRSGRRGSWRFRKFNNNQLAWKSPRGPEADPLNPRSVFEALQRASGPINLQDVKSPYNQEDPEDPDSSDSENSEAGALVPYKTKPEFDEETMLNYLRCYFPKSKDKTRYGEKTQQEGVQTVEAILEIYNQLQKKPDEEEGTSTPRRMRVELMEHQRKALTWMRWRETCKPAGGILADDMGLGKTITTIALIMRSLEDEWNQPEGIDDRNNPGGTLIVCPANLIQQWKQEIQTSGHIPDVNVYHKEKENNILRLRVNQIVITSYDTLANNHKTHQQILYKIHWKRVVLDEAHVIRNPRTLRSECVALLKTQKRWALTGTPIHNLVRDIFPIMRFLQMRPFDNSKHFNRWIANNDAAGTARLHCVMEAVMLRRMKEALVAAGLMPQLPMKTKRDVPIVLVPEERLVYDRVMTYSRTLFIQFLHQRTEKERRMALGPHYRRNNNIASVELTEAQKRFLERRGNVSRHHILTLILRLRQICCHPCLIKSMLEQEDFEEAGVDNLPAGDLEEANRELMNDLVEFDGGEEIGVDGRVVDRRILTLENPVFKGENVSSKMTAVLERVREIINNGEKVIIVSDWVGYLNIIGDHLDNIPGASYESYTGATSYAERDRIVHMFNNTDEIMILLLSLRAGGQGLNLKGANHVVLVDVHWNPQLEVQAQDRVYRIGQTRNVFIHKFICPDTIEERILDLQNDKLKIAEAVLAGSKYEVRRLELAEMCRLFNVGV